MSLSHHAVEYQAGATEGSNGALDAATLLESLVLPVASYVALLCVTPRSVLSAARPDPAYPSAVLA